MASHLIPITLVEPLTRGPSPTKVSQIAALQNFIQDLLGETHHTFLQGSYKNDTAINDINDVDIIAMRLGTYSGEHSPHVFDERIPWEQIFTEIEAKLAQQSRYSWRMDRAHKCIKITGPFNVDVVPAVKVDHDHTTDPISIYSFEDSRERVSHPRTHYENGVEKNSLTDGTYKSTVRMFKQWKANHFGEDKLISSHKIEALIHSVPNENFAADPVVNFLLSTCHIIEKLDTFGANIPSVCGNENIVDNWSVFDRKRFLDKLKESLTSAHKAYKATTATYASEQWKLAFNFS